MRSYVLIPREDGDNDAYPVDTDAELDAAADAMRDAGLESLPIYYGEPDCPDSYKSEDRVYARPLTEGGAL